jgi:4-amino-4-deoxy-L-arabinose transferase
MSGLKNFLKDRSYLLLIIFFIVSYILPLNNRMLSMPDEVRYAEISREMIQTGDWVVPHVLGLDYFEKPVAGYWLNNISQLLFGETRFAVRFATAFCTGLTGALVFWFTLQLFHCRKKAFAAAACYLSSLVVYAIGVYSVLDAMFTLWFNLSLIAFYLGLQADNVNKKIKYYGLTGAAAGLAFLTKGFIGLVVPAIVVLPYLAYRRQLSELRYLWVAVITLLIVSLPWAILVHLRAPDYWHYFFWEEHIKRFSSDEAQHKAPFFYYLPVIVFGFLPWFGLIPSAVVQAWKNTSLRFPTVFLFFWALIPFLFFSMSKGKLATYILPCFAPLAIFLGYGLQELIEKQQWRVIRVNAGINIIFGCFVALIISLIAFGVVGHNTYYEASETGNLVMALGIFVFWAAMGLFSYFRAAHAVGLTLLCPLAFTLLLSVALPRAAIYSKQPEEFVKEYRGLLNNTRLVLSDDNGLAYSLAWELKRTDIRLFRTKGEFAYGLDRTGVNDKFVSAEEFPEWLTNAKRQEDVIVVIHNNREPVPEFFQGADNIFKEHHLTLFYFKSSKLDPANE